jgi:hypothetical protein
MADYVWIKEPVNNENAFCSWEFIKYPVENILIEVNDEDKIFKVLNYKNNNK